MVEKRKGVIYDDNDAFFPVAKTDDVLEVHGAGNEKLSGEKSFHSPVNCVTVTHICMR